MHIAPDFTLPDQHETLHSLKDYRGRWVVLYFYPKDDTPACTSEACDFRDARSAIAEYGNAIVLGISKDTARSHKKFADKYSLDFTLLSDRDHSVMKAYGAWGPKKFMGREFLGTRRNTYIIDPDGNIVKKYEDIAVKDHIGQILKDLSALQAAT